jgi:hypothetical protein
MVILRRPPIVEIEPFVMGERMSDLDACNGNPEVRSTCDSAKECVYGC